MRKPKASPRVLYLGDHRNGSARYIIGALEWAKFAFTHHDCAEKPPSALTKGRHEWDVIVLSDYPRALLGDQSDCQIASLVREKGVGLIMLGGWASFTGLNGGYRGSAVAAALPVRMSEEDDRRNTPTGIVLWSATPHPLLDGFTFRRPPMLAGYNAVAPRSSATVVMNAWEVRCRGRGRIPTVELGAARPMLMLGQAGVGRTAAFASDLAPHWCGGMVDWGRGRIKTAGIEVGDLYLEFIRRLLVWSAFGESAL